MDADGWVLVVPTIWTASLMPSAKVPPVARGSLSVVKTLIGMLSPS
jgi:hypothetical protein